MHNTIQILGISLLIMGCELPFLSILKIKIDGEDVEPTGFAGFVDVLAKLNLADIRIETNAIRPGRTIKEGETKNIIVMDLQGFEEMNKKVIEIYQRVRIELTYKSMYDELFTCHIGE